MSWKTNHLAVIPDFNVDALGECAARRCARDQRDRGQQSVPVR